VRGLRKRVGDFNQNKNLAMELAADDLFPALAAARWLPS
jgi:hypothetical protein